MRVRRAFRTGASLMIAMGLVGFARCGEDTRWKLAWADEFDGPAGQSPDPTRWKFDVGTGANGWGNQQWEYDTARPENASLDGAGSLVITSRKEAFGGKDYTSARMLTKGLFTQRYGRFEARMKLPSGQGLWPALWLLGENIDDPLVGWPRCGEIDVMEYRGQERARVSGSLHGPGYSADKAITGTLELPAGRSFDEAFHVFAVEWTPDWIAWELDGKVWQVVVPEGIPAGGTWVFDRPFFVLLNVAVGGLYVGAPDPSVFPQATVVDWVRVYERAP